MTTRDDDHPRPSASASTRPSSRSSSRPAPAGRTKPRGDRPLLEVKGLHTSFKTRDGLVRAVDGIDFHVDRGEIMGLVGESGCGKSVTSLSIMRLDRQARATSTPARSSSTARTC